MLLRPEFRKTQVQQYRTQWKNSGGYWRRITGDMQTSAWRKNESSIYDSWIPNNATFSLYIRANKARIAIFLSKKNCSEWRSSQKTPPIVNKLSILLMLLFVLESTFSNFYRFSRIFFVYYTLQLFFWNLNGIFYIAVSAGVINFRGRNSFAW